jgi:mitochondrial fission protein ELM1
VGFVRSSGDPHVLWRFSDGKPGHDAQSLGLVQALQARCDIGVHELNVGSRLAALGGWLSGRYIAGRSLPRPDLLIGSGHATHWSLLAARRAYGGRAVVLMQPSLPNALFDLCLIPEHDNPRAAADVLVTTGVLNTLGASQNRLADQGLILLGGPSPHYRWSDAEVLGQVNALLLARPQLRWQVLTSRRTPASTVMLLQKHKSLTLLLPGMSSNPVVDALATAAEVRVSEDSVSMIYEALTSGAPTGLLAVTRKTANRVTAGVDALVTRGWVAPPGNWNTPATPPVLDEAGRCADWIMDQWLNVN